MVVLVLGIVAILYEELALFVEAVRETFEKEDCKMKSL